MAKLSKRELAAKKAGGTLNYKTGKVTVAPKTMVKPRITRPIGFSDPTLAAEMNPMGATINPGQQNQPLVINDTSALKPGQMRSNAKVNNKGSSSRRAEAAKAQNQKTSFSDQAMDFAGTVGAKLRNVPGLKQIAEYGDDYVNTGNRASLGKVMAPFAVGAAIPTGMFLAGAGAAGGLSSLAGVGRGVVGRGSNLFKNGVKNFGDDVVSKMPTSALPIAGAVGTGAAGFVPSIGAIMGNSAENNPFGQSVDDVVSSYPDPTQTDDGDQGQDNGGSDTSLDKEMNVGSPEIDTQNDPTLVDEMGMEQDYSQTQNNAYGGDPITDKPGGTTRRPYGSGAFGTGKGVQSDDPYIKELRKAYSSNGGEKWLRKQFEELIAALDPTYAQMQKEGTDALNAQLNNQNIQLASVMNANNTGDSEQRAQLMAGQQRDTQTALGNLLAKLAQNKAQDVSGYKSKMAESMGQLQERNQSNKQKLMEAIRAYQNDQYDQQYKNASLAGKGGTKSYGATLDKIMAERGVDATTARAIYAQQNGLRNVPMQQGDTIQELADAMGVDYATAKQMYLAEQGY